MSLIFTNCKRRFLNKMQSQRIPLGVINGNQNEFINNKRVQPKRTAKTEHKWLSHRKSKGGCKETEQPSQLSTKKENYDALPRYRCFYCRIPVQSTINLHLFVGGLMMSKINFKLFKK